MSKAVIALGSNVGDTLSNLKKAVRLLEDAGCRVLAKSKLYLTEPWGYADQDDFLNGAIIVDTELDPLSLLGVTQGIEGKMGREKLFLNGPRNIDLDILLYEEETVEKENLVIPHPRLHQRLFVLMPLNDVASQWKVPGHGKVSELLANYLGDERVILTDLSLD
ncbi:MAG TPA: 2-amino-4-hydroxy-6-hydroxymethyldihydropteridine diphosphokinase [Firmicutes bacterium]|nr:2-amino-4-hydroxy-6-hydroxymethyldihydropteridine diphosphokinase [Bacillota bacterium]